MSIPALNNTTDYSIYFKKYIDSLNLQNKLNQTNFNANYEFQKTGVIQTERPDSRTLEERYSDIEKLKVQSRLMLNKLTDSTNTDEVMNYLLKNQQIMFYFIQNFPTIQEIVKRQYSGGAFASQLISLIYKKYIQYSEEVLIPDSPAYNMISSIMTKEDANILKQNTQILELKNALQDVIPIIPSKEQVDKLLNNPEKYVKEIKLFAEKYKDALTINDINELIEAYNDRGVIRNQQNETTIYQKERLLTDKLNNYAGKIPEYIDLTVDDKDISFKGDLKKVERIPIKAKKPLGVSSAQLSEELIQKKSRLKPSFDVEDTDPLLDEMSRYYKLIPKTQFVYDTKTYNKLLNLKPKYIKIKQLEEEDVLAQLDPNVADTDEQPDAPVFGSGLDRRDQYIHRFKVLKGELLAGNNNRKLIKELKMLVVKMVKINELEPAQSLSILRELNNV